MPINLPQPFVTEAVASKTYPEIWVSDLTIKSDSNSPSFTIQSTIVPARTLEDGSKELCTQAANCFTAQIEWANLPVDKLVLMMQVIEYVTALAYPTQL